MKTDVVVFVKLINEGILMSSWYSLHMFSFRLRNVSKHWLSCFFQSKRVDIFLFLHENICYGYSLEASLRGASNEYPKHKFVKK